MSPFSVGLIFAAVTTFALALWVLLLRSNQRMHYVFVLYLISVGFWAAFSAVQTISSNPNTVLGAARLMHWGAILISVFFLHFLYYLTRKIPKAIIIVCYVGAFVFLVLNNTSLFVSGIKPQPPFHYFMTAGPFYPIYVVFFLITWSYAVFHLYGQMKASTGTRREQLRLLFIGSLIGYVGGSGAFLPVYNLSFPIIYPYGSFAIAITVTFMTYDIVKHGLMDIEVIIKKAIIFGTLFGAVFGAFVGITVLTQELFAGGRFFGLALSSIMIILTVRPLENFLVNATDKFLFQKKYNPAELIRAFSKDVLTELDLNQITKSTVEKLSEILRIESCAVFIPDKGGDRFVIKDSNGLSDTAVSFENNSGIVSELNKADGIMLAGSDRSPSLFSKELNEINASIVFAVKNHEQLIGILSLGKKKSDEEYTREDIDILRILVDALGVAIKNALTFEQARQKEKLAAIGTLASGIKHDISTPINSMSTSIQSFLIEKNEGLHQKMSNEEVLSEAYNLLTRSRMTFDKVIAISSKFSDAARPKTKAGAEPVDILKAIEECVGVVDHLMQIKGIQLEKEIESDLPMVLCDRDYMQQILVNLVRNAIDAVEEAHKSKEESKVIIIAKRYSEKGVRIQVKDTGTGIREDRVKKIFDAYYTTKPEGKGTGLGLALVKELVERIKGTVSVQSKLGEGTTFILEFENE